MGDGSSKILKNVLVLWGEKQYQEESDFDVA
jgi:hypothetical protein